MPFPTSIFAQTGRFTGIHPIGQGAAGQVYAALDNLGRQVAVKEALPSTEAFASIRSKFEKESRIQATLNHPNIIQVYHLEEDPQTHELYLVCEYANTGALAGYLDQHGSLDERQAFSIAMDICAALEETQRQKVVHRDIKPSNILLNRDADGRLTAKLSDFGVVQDHKQRRTTVFPGATHPGTPLYMAPEQADATAILDTRADIYSLGITLWEMLTREDYKVALRDAPTPDLGAYAPTASAGAATIIQNTVQSDPARRYQTPQDLRNDLQRVLAGQPPLTIIPAPPRPPVVNRMWSEPPLQVAFFLGISLVATAFLYSMLSWWQRPAPVAVGPSVASVSTPTGLIAPTATVSIGMMPPAVAGGTATPTAATETATVAPQLGQSFPFMFGGLDEMLQGLDAMNESLQRLGPTMPSMPQLGQPFPTSSSGSNFSGSCVRGSGQVVSATRPVSDFSAIHLNAIGALIVQQGATEALTITTDNNVLPLLISDVRNGQLILDIDPAACLRSASELAYQVTVNDLSAVRISGVGEVWLQQINTEQLLIEVTGTGAVTTSGQVEQLLIEISGAGKVTAFGQADQLDVDISGIGSLRGEDLESANAQIEISGSGSATVNARDTLTIEISGLGSVDYLGMPQITQQISVAGSIRQR